ncbi:phage replisome organizer, putative, N-terminal region [Halolactibacillus halophilus]|uniref:Replisome organizer n=1 Tax=Halolactibacillus halophilus TaxID=306540 RepID=A0A1I5MP86_9BACI|nr:phage replisome organizer N-terminal domain-containing protein [Halolactibacillus halophilus]GEM02882.1 replisome organizer [Halolactibacillus halophilus]SFP11323.1 phage replisome organizer, putative, N-terminal region [Halolactibacillus halophilus]
MAKTKRFYWLKLKNDFFNQREIKKLRKIAGGDTFTIIYLKMQLLSIKNDGIISFEGTEDGLDEQLSLELDEDIDNVKLTLAFLHTNNLIENITEDDYLLNKVPDVIGSESESAERVRRLRNKKNGQKTLHCNDGVTEGNTEIEKELDIELEKEKDIVRDLFDHFLSQGIIQHKKLTNTMRSATKARLKDYSFDELKQAINNYAMVFKSEKHWFTHKYTFADLMRDKDIRKFVDEADPINNFAKDSYKQKTQSPTFDYNPDVDAF